MIIFDERTLKTNLQGIKESLHKNWGWYIVIGLFLIALGALDITFSVFTTIVSVIFFACLLLIAGIAMIYHAIRFWKKQWGEFVLHILMGILYGMAGLWILNYPLLGAISLTWALVIFYFYLGIVRISVATMQPLPGWGWMLVNGLLSLILGGIILMYWPAVSFWVIGFVVGIDILAIGWWLVMLGWSARTEDILMDKPLTA